MTGEQISCHAPIGQSQPHQSRATTSERKKFAMKRSMLPVAMPWAAPIMMTMGEM